MSLKDDVAALLPENLAQMNTGTVASISGNTTNVNIRGAVIPMARLTSYSPAVGDRVAVLKAGQSWLILSKIVGPVP